MEMETIKDLILRYGVILGKRHTEKQKIKFLRTAKKQFEDNNFCVDITKVTSSFMKSEKRNFYNLYAGDVKHADTVIVSYYDTPLYTPFTKNQKAFDAGYTKSAIIVQLVFVIVFILAVVSFIYLKLIPNLKTAGFLSMWSISLLLICLATFYIIMHIREGVSNRFHMVRNSSSLIAMFLTASEMKEALKHKTAFAFIDEGTQSEYGLTMLNEYIGKRKVKRIYLDCVGNEGELQCFSDMAFTKLSGIKTHKREAYMKPYGDILLTSGVFHQGCVIIPHANRRSDKTLSETKVKDVGNQLIELIKHQ